jgi:hypothetical protein
MENVPRYSIALFVTAHVLSLIALLATLVVLITKGDPLHRSVISLFVIPAIISGLVLFSTYAQNKWGTKIGLTVWVATIILVFFVVLGTFSSPLWLFYLPSTLILLVATYLRERKLQPPRPRSESWD